MPDQIAPIHETPAPIIPAPAPAPSEPVHVEPIKLVETSPAPFINPAPIIETPAEQELELLHKIEADVEKQEEEPKAEEPAPESEPVPAPVEEPPFYATEYVTAAENGNHKRTVVAGEKGKCIAPPADPAFPRFISITQLHPFDTKEARDRAVLGF